MQPTAAMSPALNFFTALPTFAHAPHDFVPGHQRVNRGHHVFPFIAHLMQI